MPFFLFPTDDSTHHTHTRHPPTSLASQTSSPHPARPNAATATATVHIVPTDPTSWVLAPVFVPKRQRDSASAAAADAAEADDEADGEGATASGVCAGLSYAQCVGTAGAEGTVRVLDEASGRTELRSAGERLVCPYRRDVDGSCPYGDRCGYDHGEPCDLCGRYVLSPVDAAQRKHHREVSAVLCLHYCMCGIFSGVWYLGGI